MFVLVPKHKSKYRKRTKALAIQGMSERAMFARWTQQMVNVRREGWYLRVHSLEVPSQ